MPEVIKGSIITGRLKLGQWGLKLQAWLSEIALYGKIHFMEAQQAFYISKLKESLMARQTVNPQYSLRAFARDLDIDSSTLSQIINGKRSIPVKNTSSIASKLNLNDRDFTLFLESTKNSESIIDKIKISPVDQRFMLDESFYKVIAEWEHYALLDLFELDDFENSVDYIMKKLDLTESRTETVIQNLITCGLLARNAKGELSKSHSDVRTTEDREGKALNDAHLEELEIAREKLQTIDKSLRDFSSSTFAIDMSKMVEAKTIIREFRQKMAALLKNGKKTEVYMLTIQFFPLSKENKSKGSRGLNG